MNVNKKSNKKKIKLQKTQQKVKSYVGLQNINYSISPKFYHFAQHKICYTNIIVKMPY